MLYVFYLFSNVASSRVASLVSTKANVAPRCWLSYFSSVGASYRSNSHLPVASLEDCSYLGATFVPFLDIGVSQTGQSSEQTESKHSQQQAAHNNCCEFPVFVAVST